MKKEAHACLGCFFLVFLLFMSFVTGIILLVRVSYWYEEREQRHVFRLLEEQEALYIKQHYEGVAKIEFSPIFVDYNGFTRDYHVFPIVTDQEGNRAGLSGYIWGVNFLAFSPYYAGELQANGGSVKAKDYKTLPKEAYLQESPMIDEMLDGLMKDGKLKGLKKSSVGSPQVSITYNLKITEGPYFNSLDYNKGTEKVEAPIVKHYHRLLEE